MEKQRKTTKHDKRNYKTVNHTYIKHGIDVLEKQLLSLAKSKQDTW